MWRWNLFYLGRPRWDSGITPPEVVRVIEVEGLPPGRALDLGCGTGTNVLYLARHGFETVGVDVAALAILRARWRLWRARRTGIRLAATHPLAGDVRSLPPAARRYAPFDFALDIGCLHSLDPAGRRAYAAGLRDLMRPGATYMLYTFRPGPDGPRGIAPGEIEALFGGAFRQVSLEEGGFRERVTAWYRFERN